MSNMQDHARIGFLIVGGLVEKYYDLAKQRASEDDKPIFDVKLEVVLFKFKGQPVKLPKAYSVLVFVHLAFLALWLALLATYFAPLRP